MQNTYYMKKYFAEGIGTFALVLFGCGAAVVSGKTLPDTIMSGAPAGIGVLGIALAFGLAVVIMCYAGRRHPGSSGVVCVREGRAQFYQGRVGVGQQ